ncbi:MAG: EthD domain-containing protein [bacterium]|nr:EthD domain-containing protein [bacterium]
MIKLVYCVRRNPALSAEEFRKTWLNDHGPLVKSLRKVLGMVRYVQSHTLVEASEAVRQPRGAAPPYDGITEVWFERLESLGVDAEAATEAARLLLEDEKRFIDLENSAVFLTEEHEIF